MRLNETEIAKIDRFLEDTVMSDAVYDVILNAFLKQKKRDDIHALAASRIAIDLLEEAWKELNTWRVRDEGAAPKSNQIGV